MEYDTIDSSAEPIAIANEMFWLNLLFSACTASSMLLNHVNNWSSSWQLHLISHIVIWLHLSTTCGASLAHFICASRMWPDQLTDNYSISSHPTYLHVTFLSFHSMPMGCTESNNLILLVMKTWVNLDTVITFGLKKLLAEKWLSVD